MGGRALEARLWAALAAGGDSLVRTEGSAHSPAADNGASMRRSHAAALAALGSLALCLASLAAALTGEVDLGVDLENPGGLVAGVVPGGPAWEAGIRAGQQVVTLHAASDPGGWALETTDGTTAYRLTAASADAPLRLGGVASLSGVLLALAALWRARDGARTSGALSALAPAAGALPWLSAGPGLVPSLGLVAAAVGPLGWTVIARSAGRWRQAAAIAGAALVGAGAGLRTSAGAAAPWLLSAWALVVGTGVVLLVVVWSGLTLRGAADRVRSLTLLDAALAAAVGLLAAVMTAAGFEAPWIAALVAVALAAYARTRRALVAGLDRALFADLRERSAMRAAEEERSRLARDIHDDSLQAIAGVIRALEGPDPDAAAARESLRGAAARLRAVATELHPPALDDLGLVPAIEAAARAAGGGIEIEVQVEDRTGYSREGRPPGEVELAAYRVVTEAVANAVRHSGGRRVRVSGVVAADQVELSVEDDGAGFSPARAESALREGRIGLASMRQRAAGVDARLDVGRGPVAGTMVSMRWQA